MELITLTTSHATATISPYGAQVMSFTPKGQLDVLWQTTPEFLATAITNSKALRGGIPICWPWFNAHPTDKSAPNHGLGRTQVWALTEHTNTPEQSTAIFTLTLDGTHPAWPHKTEGHLIVTLTDTLTVSLTTTNLSDTPISLTQALHTYLAVEDISTAQIHALAGLTRRHVTSGTPLSPIQGPYTITQEVENLVAPVTKPVTVTDPLANRALTIMNLGSEETVIWNPWIEKSAKLDMPEGSYRNMLCLEAANIDRAPILTPNESHTLTTILSASAI